MSGVEAAHQELIDHSRLVLHHPLGGLCELSHSLERLPQGLLERYHLGCQGIEVTIRLVIRFGEHTIEKPLVQAGKPLLCTMEANAAACPTIRGGVPRDELSAPLSLIDGLGNIGKLAHGLDQGWVVFVIGLGGFNELIEKQWVSRELDQGACQARAGHPFTPWYRKRVAPALSPLLENALNGLDQKAAQIPAVCELVTSLLTGNEHCLNLWIGHIPAQQLGCCIEITAVLRGQYSHQTGGQLSA